MVGKFAYIFVSSSSPICMQVYAFLFIYLWVVVILFIAHTHIVFFFFAPLLTQVGIVNISPSSSIAESLRFPEMAEWIGWNFPGLSVEVSEQELGQRRDQVFH